MSLVCEAHPLPSSPISTAGLGGPSRAQLSASAAACGQVGMGPGAGATTILGREGLGRCGPSPRGQPVGPGALPRGGLLTPPCALVLSALSCAYIHLLEYSG